MGGTVAPGIILRDLKPDFQNGANWEIAQFAPCPMVASDATASCAPAVLFARQIEHVGDQRAFA